MVLTVQVLLLEFVVLGLQAIEGHKSAVLGDYDLILVGGVESMTNSPHLIYNKKPTKYGDIIVKDSMLLMDLQIHFQTKLCRRC